MGRRRDNARRRCSPGHSPLSLEKALTHYLVQRKQSRVRNPWCTATESG